MGCCNEPSIALTQSGQNPAWHVNYTKGMVLGVDDFTQEFTYLSNRDQWVVRELLGYGTTSGLAVSIEDAGSDEPRLHIRRGSAVVPSGKLVCVPEDQCALLNKWLEKTKNANKISELLAGNSLPASEGKVSLFLTLRYADCTTIPVPIPGEPCRSNDKLMADSRIADDYYLELRTEVPPQTEEDAISDFVAWLKQVPIIETGSMPKADEKIWLDGLKAAAKPWFDAMAAIPPLSPPTTLAVARVDLAAFLRVAFRFWVTELKPMWMSCMCGAGVNADDDCVLLAQLELPVIWVGGSPTGAWRVNDKAVEVEGKGEFKNIHIDESRRPYLAHMRLLQEWLLCGGENLKTGTAPDIVLPKPPILTGLTTPVAAPIGITAVSADLMLDASHHCVICNGGLTLTLPKCTADNQGRVYILKSQSGSSTINSDPADTIDGANTKTVASKKAVTLVSDGLQTWHVIATA